MSGRVSGLVSGYDYNFVDTVPDRLLCQICHLPCRDPQTIVCCGKVFCKSELSTDGDQLQECPVCKEKSSEIFLNKALRREINALSIYCPNKKEGCGWVGEISLVDDHLKECEISCSKCKQLVRFSTMKSHLDTECPCYCPYCDITAERKVISSEHNEKCHKFPITCPNNCGLEDIPRDCMEEHKSVCPLEMVFCEYRCGAMMVRHEIDQHNKNKVLQHIRLLKHMLTNLSQNATDLELKCLEMEEEFVTSSMSLSNSIKNIAINIKCNALNENVKQNKSISRNTKALSHPCFKFLKHQILLQKLFVILMILFLLFRGYEYYTIVVMKSDLPIVSDTEIHISIIIDELIDQIPPFISNGNFKHFNWHWKLQLECWSKTGLIAPIVIEMPNVDKYRDNKLQWVSNPFYAFEGGYLMCMKVSVAGYDDGIDTYMSVYLYLMKGQHDDELSWPMRGEYTIVLLNQVYKSMKSDFLTVYFDTNVSTVVKDYQRVTMGKVNRIGIGFPQYISHRKLFANFFGSWNYLSEDRSLFFKVSYRQIV